EPARPRGRAATLPTMQRVWSPTVRFFAVAAGAPLALWGLRHGGPAGLATSLGGIALALRGATNLEMKRLVGIGAGRQAITLQKTINIDAPVEEVFDLWSRYENFPRFMSHVREVTRTAEGRSHWVVTGPGGLSIEWDTEESARVPNRIIAWRTVPGSIIGHSGIVRFDPNAKGGTRVHIRTSWNPPAGALGYGLSAILGSDPKRALDDDLVRLKSLLEQGKTSAHGERVTRDTVTG
ncbi:MAG TPA: SRPBCC family protein, partial [Candidatus Tectomicrobia bacterium]|nr:SRPBCC family protein [Candidatus Tectomicrobia bacterium]